MTKLVSIRGAVTAANTKESIESATRRLIERIYFKNALSDENIVNITVSSTADITAFYPVRAIREAGHDVPLFSCVEPSIKGSLCGCIRVMVTAYSDVPTKNVYLNGARVLRSDIAGAYAIALDGPSGAGKSTVAKLVAKTLGVTYLDTGALYRALGLKALENNIEPTDEVNIRKLLTPANVKVVLDNGTQRVIVDGDDVTGRIRTQEVAMAASKASALPFVREKLLDTQRDFAKKNSVIVDGRDIGTVVLPTAEFKFFLTASAEVRAKRRYDELMAKGEKVDYNTVLNDVNARDLNDSTRAIAPLKKAFDAIEIDSSDMTADEVAARIVATVKEDL